MTILVGDNDAELQWVEHVRQHESSHGLFLMVVLDNVC